VRRQSFHNRTGEDNADAHLKRQIMGREVVVAITKGKLDLACPAVAPAKEEPLGTNLLRRIRRPPPQTRAGENYR
jgi:hypothetical protein